MAEVLTAYTTVLAPILPHMAEDIWQSLPYEVAHQSVFEAGWPTPSGASDDERAGWEAVRALRDVVNKVLEEARVEKTIGSSLEAKLIVHTDDPTLSAALTALAASSNGVDELRYIFITSKVELADSAEAVTAASSLGSRTDATLQATVGLAPAAGLKCERCWNYCPSVGSSEAYAGVCERCDAALEAMAFPPVAISEVAPAEAEAEAAAAA